MHPLRYLASKDECQTYDISIPYSSNKRKPFEMYFVFFCVFSCFTFCNNIKLMKELSFLLLSLCDDKIKIKFFFLPNLDAFIIT